MEEALPLLRAAGDQRLEALGALLSCRAQLSRVPRDAARSAEAGLGLYTELGDVVGQGKAQAWLARAHMEAQKPREALEAAMACADLAQSAKAQGEAMCLVASVHAFREKCLGHGGLLKRVVQEPPGGAIRRAWPGGLPQGTLQRRRRGAEAARRLPGCSEQELA